MTKGEGGRENEEFGKKNLSLDWFCADKFFSFTFLICKQKF